MECIEVKQCLCSFQILGSQGFFPATRGGIIKAAFSIDLMTLFRTLNLKCAISTTQFFNTIKGNAHLFKLTI